MNYIIYLAFRIFVAVFYFMPFWLLYAFSDFLSFIFYHVARYRTKVVLTNLRNSFPDKQEEEIGKIAKGFYRHLADMLVESLKAFTLTEDAVRRRYVFRNAELVNDFYREGRSVIMVAGHYGNWEWPGLAAGTQLLHKPVGFYKPLSNKFIDRYLQRSRVKGRSQLASITHTAEIFARDWGEPVVFYMVADQSPSSGRLAYWLKFLNQDTAVLHGPEKYARLRNLPVIYARIKKIRRGNYTAEFVLLETEPAGSGTGVITERFMRMLEADIKEEPRYYLWSHRRWKLNRSR